MKRLFLLIPFLFLMGCMTDFDMGHGRVGHLFQAAAGSITAVSDSRSRLYNCPQPTIDKDNWATKVYDFEACTPMESEWRQSAAQPITGQAVGGLFIGAGAGVGGALSEGGNAISNAVSSSTGGGGRH